jgi:hypothetical protein
MTKFNYVDDYSGLYATDLNDNSYDIQTYPIVWNFLNNSSTPRIDEVTYRHSSRLSIEIRNSITESYSFESIEFVISADSADKLFSFNAMLKCNAPANVSIYLHEYGELFSTVEPVTTQLSTAEWTACFSNVFEFSDKNKPVYGLGVRIVISEHAGQIVHFTMPNLVDDRPFLSNTYYNPARQFFPDVYYDVDSEETNPTFPFFKLLHSLTGVSDTVMKEYLSVFQYEDAEKPVSIKSQLESSAYNEFSSELTNPEIMPNEYTAWASMFIGNLVKSGIYITEDATINSPIKYIIGDTGPAGGKIFITPSTPGNNTGKYFEAFEVQTYVFWTDPANQATELFTASPSGIGKGYEFTNTIIDLGPSAYITIESIFASASHLGYTDWFVPSLEELEALWEVRNDVGIPFYEEAQYWASSEYYPSGVGNGALGASLDWLTGISSGLAKDANMCVTIPVRMFDAPTFPVTIPGTVQQEVLPDSLDFRRKQLSTRMYGFSAGTKGAIRNAARAIIGEDAAVVITPNWNNDQWSIMVRTVTASTPGVSGSGQFSAEVYQVMEPAKPAGYSLLHSTLDEITFVLDDNDFGVFDQSVLG